MATVGTGTYTYELVEDWAKLPAGWTLGQTGIVTDARDRVYLFNRSAHPLMVLDQDGTFFTSWGEGVLSSAHGMFIDEHENIYLPVINAHVVLKYSPGGNLVRELSRSGQTGGRPLPSSVRCRYRADGRDLYLGRLWQRPHPPVLAGRQLAAIMGSAGEGRPGRVPRPAWGLGAYRWSGVGGGPGEQSHPDLLPGG